MQGGAAGGTEVMKRGCGRGGCHEAWLPLGGSKPMVRQGGEGESWPMEGSGAPDESK